MLSGNVVAFRGENKKIMVILFTESIAIPVTIPIVWPTELIIQLYLYLQRRTRTYCFHCTSRLCRNLYLVFIHFSYDCQKMAMLTFPRCSGVLLSALALSTGFQPQSTLPLNSFQAPSAPLGVFTRPPFSAGRAFTSTKPSTALFGTAAGAPYGDQADAVQRFRQHKRVEREEDERDETAKRKVQGEALHYHRYFTRLTSAFKQSLYYYYLPCLCRC